MKKIIIIMIILFMPIIVFGKEYSVEELNYKIDINDNDYMVFTRDNIENNQELSILNLTPEQMNTIMQNGNIYIDIIDRDLKYEIVMVVLNTGILDTKNFSNYSDEMLETAAKSYANTVGSEKYSVYKANHNYVVIDYYDSKTKYYIINYYTVVNGKGYNFQMQKTSAFTNGEKSSLKSMVDTINIKVLDEYKDETKDTYKTQTKKGIDWGSVKGSAIKGAIIGAVAGVIGAIAKLLTKKKNKKEEQ
ncbi:MAG: hypothetical protein IKR57_00505 [Bacilli bacterium]|nr:hypothetical protein [Bacilli bacterium]